MDSLSDFLGRHHYPIEYKGNEITGPGTEFLRREAAAAHFFLVGEEHGVGSNLDFAAAFARAIRSLGYDAYAAEIGPQSAAYINRWLAEADPEAAARAFFERWPFSIPFAWNREELALMRVFAQTGSERPPVIGIDQEFVLSPQLHLENLRDRVSEESLRTLLDAWVNIEQQANREMADGKSPDQLVHFMSTPLPAAWPALRAAFTAAGEPDPLALMDDLEASHEIYRLYQTAEYHANNDNRGRLMKGYFYKAYRERLAADPESRFFVKLGANHVKRGHSVLGIQDIGNFISEIAVAAGQDSFHLLVLPTGGAQNLWLPFLPETFKAHPIDPADYGAGIAYLIKHAPVLDGWNLYDLRPLRNRQRSWSQEEPAFKDVFLGYDAVLLMKDVQPAVLLTDR